MSGLANFFHSYVPSSDDHNSNGNGNDSNMKCRTRQKNKYDVSIGNHLSSAYHNINNDNNNVEVEEASVLGKCQLDNQSKSHLIEVPAQNTPVHHSSQKIHREFYQSSTDKEKENENEARRKKVWNIMAVKKWNKERTPAVLKYWERRCNIDSNSSSVSNIEEQNIHDDRNELELRLPDYDSEDLTEFESQPTSSQKPLDCHISTSPKHDNHHNTDLNLNTQEIMHEHNNNFLKNNQNIATTPKRKKRRRQNRIPNHKLTSKNSTSLQSIDLETKSLPLGLCEIKMLWRKRETIRMLRKDYSSDFVETKDYQNRNNDDGPLASSCNYVISMDLEELGLDEVNPEEEKRNISRERLRQVPTAASSTNGSPQKHWTKENKTQTFRALTVPAPKKRFRLFLYNQFADEMNKCLQKLIKKKLKSKSTCTLLVSLCNVPALCLFPYQPSGEKGLEWGYSYSPYCVCIGDKSQLFPDTLGDISEEVDKSGKNQNFDIMTDDLEVRLCECITKNVSGDITLIEESEYLLDINNILSSSNTKKIENVKEKKMIAQQYVDLCMIQQKKYSFNDESLKENQGVVMNVSESSLVSKSTNRVSFEFRNRISQHNNNNLRRDQTPSLQEYYKLVSSDFFGAVNYIVLCVH